MPTHEQAAVVHDRPVPAPRLAAGPPGTAGGPEPRTPPVSQAERDALHLWRRMALAATTEATPQPRRVPVPTELRGALRLFEEAVEGSLNGGPSVPSAGALHPYEHVVVAGGAGGPSVFAVDVARRTCRLTYSGEQVTRALDDSGLPLPGPDAFLVLTVVRPWLSMRKYGDRGYLYAQLDAAHLGAHLLCLGSRSHRRAEWLTRAASEPLAALLGLADNCRFLHSVLLLDDVVDSCPEPSRSWTCTDARNTEPGVPPLAFLEGQSWRTVAPYRQAAPARTTLARRAPLLPAAPDAEGLLRDGALSRLLARRRSTKDFAPADLPGGALRKALSALATPLTTDLPEADGFGATLVALQVAGVDPGAYPLRGGRIAAEPAVRAVADRDSIVRICMGQEHLRHTAAAVVLHTRRHRMFPRGMAGVDQALLRAGALAHLLCLGATGAGIAVTTIGGFDSRRWHALASLPEEDEVLYVAMLGTGGTAPVKLDRLQRTYAHDER
ncbi:nitroreductase family protein [Streptomyces albidoflavus]|uniref:nitroreductase family protein n=2 Tax=Streptomyces albidoflavus TaxID=1886 RepID=UPI00101E4901|nr:nitroreductase family protein [Streptomyces albidoflavus]RZD87865.1 hypothetical protein C0Q60_04430 [Streptomyces albidoflavus]RZE03340.1 hypothetical protein C0Q62_04345 [Streptomyces albidoflavus]